jgi:hypothetical protein
MPRTHPRLLLRPDCSMGAGRGQRKHVRVIDLTEGGSAYEDLPVEAESQESQESQDLEAAFEEAHVAGKLPPPGASQANPIDLCALDTQEQAWIDG